jgi:hypothetical protein
VRVAVFLTITPNATPSLIKALTTRFTSDFSACFTLTSAFRAFNIARVDFFALGATNFTYAFNVFFVARLAFFKSVTNQCATTLVSFSSCSFYFLRAFAARLTLLSYLRFSFTSFSTSFSFIKTLALITCASK